jgi:hypothetical protein
VKQRKGSWYWLTVLSPFLGDVGSRGAGDRAREESDQALRDLLQLFLALPALLLALFIFKLFGLI